MSKEKKDKKRKKSWKRVEVAEAAELEAEAGDMEALEEADRPKPQRSKSPFFFLRNGIGKLLSNLRFSLTLRIAIHYAGQLLRSTLTVLLIVTVVFAVAQIPTVTNALDAIEEAPPAEEGHYSKQQLMGLPVTDAYLLAEPLSGDWQGLLAKVELAFSEFSVGKHSYLLIYMDSMQGPLVVKFPLDYVIYVYTLLFWALLCSDLYRVFRFLSRRNRLNNKVLKPITDMADAAAALSANNLSNRISIEGTKNELKDLAVVINLMLDRIERSYNSQRQFVSDASHELRTPIAVIQGYASMLERWGKTDKAVLDEGITAISQETTAMKELVERLLFLARHDKKTLMLEMEVFDPTEVMSCVHRDAKMLSPAHEFDLQLKGSALVSGDKGMIKQLMRILVDNAIKYTPAGGKITLTMSRTGNECVLAVTDTGAGISREELPRIFDRFYRSDKARKAQSSGHGLGLSIGRIIVVAHGGKLNVRSKEGAGTTFSVKLPVSVETR